MSPIEKVARVNACIAYANAGNSDHGSATVEWYVDKRVAALWFLFLFNGA